MKIFHNKEWLEIEYQKYGTSTIAKHCNVDDATIMYWLKKHSIKTRTRGESMRITSSRKHHVNEEYFNQIDTPQKAYWLGLIMADGNITKSSKSETLVLELSLQTSDSYLLKEFKEEVSATYEVKQKGNQSRISICNYKLCSRLIELGVIPRKTTREVIPEEIPENLIPSFILGYFDGDGSISWKKEEKRVRAKVHFVSGETVITQIAKHFEKKGVYMSPKSVHKNKYANAYELEIASLPNIAKIYDILYRKVNEDLSLPHLQRKKERYDSFIECYILNCKTAAKRYSPTSVRKAES